MAASRIFCLHGVKAWSNTRSLGYERNHDEDTKQEGDKSSNESHGLVLPNESWKKTNGVSNNEKSIPI